MLYELRRFHKLSISTENNVAQNTQWLHCAVSNYRGKTKFQIYSSKYLHFLPLVVYFTSDFNKRRTKLCMIELTDWTVQRWSDNRKTWAICSSGCDFGSIR